MLGRLTLLAFLAGLAPAAAQPPDPQAPGQPPAVPQTTGVESPERPFQGLFGGEPRRTRMLMRNEFTFTFTLTGGYDDNLAGETSGGLPPIGANSDISGYSGVATVALTYTLVRRRGAVSFFGSASGSEYSYYDYDGVPYGVTGGLSGSATLDPRTRLTSSARVSREPYLQLGAFDSLREVVGPDETPGNAPPFSVGDRASLVFDVEAGLERRFTRADTFNVGYRLFSRYFEEATAQDPTAGEGDGRNQAVSASYSRALSPHWFIEPGYTYSRGNFAALGSLGERPMTQHNYRAMLRHERRLSPTRRLHFSAGGGATQIRTINEIGQQTEIWEPSGEAAASMDIARTWALDAGYRRALVYLGGFTDDTYLSDAFTLGASGLVGSRVRLSISGSMAGGDAAAAVTETGSFRSYTGSVSLGVPLGRTMSFTIGYLYYSYEFDDPTTLPEGTPPNLDRNGVRAAFTLTLPPAARGGSVRQ
jgi:hypothetical protein